MPNSSGYVDWNQQLAATGDEEQRLFDEAVARAEGAQGKANFALQHASGDAGEQGVGLSETASYSDFLQAKQNAAKAWAATTGPDANPRSVRGAMMGRGKGEAAGADLADRENRLGERNAGNAGAHATFQREQQERASAAQAAQAEREKSDLDARNKHLGGVYGRWLELNGRGGGTSERDRYAQMMSGGIDQGWQLPGQNAEQKTNSKYGDRRGFAIEQQAWGTPSKSFGRPTTKKGTAY